MPNKSILPVLFSLLLCLVFCCPAPLFAGDQNTTALDNYNGINETLDTLVATMLKYERGVPSDMNQLLKLLEPPKFIQSDRRDTYVLNAARRLYLVLQNVDYDGFDDIPKNITGDHVTLSLGDKSSHQIEIHMIKKPDGTWVIAPKTLEDKHLRQVYEHVKARYAKLTRADTDGEYFNPNLMSPFKTMLTFHNGVRGLSGFTMEDAVSALDMSEINPVLRKILGPTLAVYINRVLAFRSPLELTELSADPMSETIPILLVTPEYGVITLHVVENPDTKEKAWKLTPKSLETAANTYDDFMSEGMVRAMTNDGPNHEWYEVKNPPLHILADDFFQFNFPALEKDFFGMDLWEWLCIVLILVLTPLTWLLTGTLIRGLGSVLGSKAGFEDNMHFKSLLLPLRLAVIANLWLEGLIIVTTNQQTLLVATTLLDLTIIVTGIWTAIVLVNNIAGFLVSKTNSNVSGTIIQVVSKIANILLLLVGAVSIASALGQDSTRILTALGIGGIALALAGKDTVENFLGTAMIVSTRPFAIGDWILINNIEGTVESVGVRSTSIRTFYNSLVNVPNATFVSSPVDNMGKRQYRRYRTIIGVEYGTPPDLISAYVEGLKEIVRNHPVTRKDYFHIQPNDFGPSSVSILVYLFFVTDDWSVELQERGRFILDALRLAEKLGIKIALPAQTLHMLQTRETKQTAPEDEIAAQSMGKNAALDILQKHN